jgi:hypothetical protein
MMILKRGFCGRLDYTSMDAAYAYGYKLSY